MSYVRNTVQQVLTKDFGYFNVVGKEDALSQVILHQLNTTKDKEIEKQMLGVAKRNKSPYDLAMTILAQRYSSMSMQKLGQADIEYNIRAWLDTRKMNTDLSIYIRSFMYNVENNRMNGRKPKFVGFKRQ